MKSFNKKKFTSSYVYNHSINTVWDLIKDISNVAKIDPVLKFEVNFEKGNFPWEIGATFNLIALNCYIVTQVKDVEEKEDYKRLQYKSNVKEPFDFEYYFTCSLYVDTLHNTTLFIIDIESENDSNGLLEKMAVNNSELLKKFNDYLNIHKEELSQTESLVLEINRDCLWAIVSNWLYFKKVVPFIADTVIYEGDPKMVGTKLRLKWEQKNVECFLKVEKVFNEKNSSEWEYSMLCYKGVPSVTQQEIKFKIIRINKHYSFLEFKHVFKQSIKKEILSTIAQDKKKILLTLKEKIEKFVKSQEK